MPQTTENADMTWTNSTLLPAADASGAISGLRKQAGQDIQVMGSANLAQQLIEHDLVDEYRLMIEPIVLGGGKRLFPDDSRSRPLELVSVSKSRVHICCYRPAAATAEE